MNELRKKKLFINNFGNDKINYRGYVEKIKMYNPELIESNNFILGENLKGRPLFLNLDFNTNALIIGNSLELLEKRILAFLELNNKIASNIEVHNITKSSDNLGDVIKILDGIICFNKKKQNNTNLLKGNYLFILSGFSSRELKKSGIMDYVGKIKNVNFLIALKDIDYADNFTNYTPELFKIVLTKNVPFGKKTEYLDKSLGINDFWYYFSNSNSLFKVQIPFIGNNKEIKYKEESYDDVLV